MAAVDGDGSRSLTLNTCSEEDGRDAGHSCRSCRGKSCKSMLSHWAAFCIYASRGGSYPELHMKMGSTEDGEVNNDSLRTVG